VLLLKLRLLSAFFAGNLKLQTGIRLPVFPIIKTKARIPFGNIQTNLKKKRDTLIRDKVIYKVPFGILGERLTINFVQKDLQKIMNDPAASGRGIRQGFSFKSRGKPQGIKPTGGIQLQNNEN